MEGEVKHNIDKLIVELKQIVKSKNELNESENSSVIKILDSLVNVSKTSVGETTDFEVDDVFLILLSHESKEIVAKAAKAIAEIAKTERGREQYTNIELVNALINLLKKDDIDILTQASRALGNICYENENGKKLIQKTDGLKVILAVMKKGVNFKDAEGASFLRSVTAGLLLNILVDQQFLQKQAVEEEAVPIICSILESEGTTGGEAAMHALLTLGILNDAGTVFLNEQLTKVLVDILASDTSSELSEMCLELFHGQADDEVAKSLLAKAGVCELLLKLLEKHGPHCTDEETRSVLKVACNLIVLILTGDDSMNLLYDGSNGTVYKKLVEWLESDDEDLKVTAVLAMGNFARTDTHCKLMVSQGVHKKLLKLLQANDSETGGIRFQHALLSALRNLVIPADNKETILNDGLIDILYPMLDIPTFPVVFKLLGTLRIVIGGQREAAISLGKKGDLIKRTVEWCNADHPGVQGEANRLIAWLINNSRDKDVAISVIKHDAVKYLIKMLMAQHAVMQNEAILSLTILSTISLTEMENILIEADIGSKVLCKFFEDYANDLELSILYNVFSFVESMIKSDTLKKYLIKSKLPATWKKTLKGRELDTSLRERIKALSTAMGTEFN